MAGGIHPAPTALESMLLLLLLLVSAAARDGCGPAPLPSSRPRPAPSYLAALTWNCNREGGRISPLARSCALPPRVSSNPSCTVSSTAAGNLGAGLWGSACSRAESTARRRAFSYTVVSVALRSAPKQRGQGRRRNAENHKVGTLAKTTRLNRRQDSGQGKHGLISGRREHPAHGRGERSARNVCHHRDTRLKCTPWQFQ